jgi:hypothetical protein
VPLMADAVSVLVALAPDPRSGWGACYRSSTGLSAKAFYMALAAYGRLVADDPECIKVVRPRNPRARHAGSDGAVQPPGGGHIRADLERLTRLVSLPASGEKGGAAAHGMAQLAEYCLTMRPTYTDREILSF